MKSISNSRFIDTLAIGGIFALLVNLLPLPKEQAMANPQAEKLFGTNCAACHTNGGNVVDPKKPLKGSKQLATKEQFKAVLEKPVGAMPAFPAIVANDSDLTALYNYCKNLK